MTGTTRPVVAVWKATWLPTSQTFVHNQVLALRRWRPLLIGVRRLPDGLPVTPDRAPFPPGRLGQVVHRISAASGYRGVYDELLRSSGTQVVHAHFGTSAVGVLPVARRHRLPLVATFHGFDVTKEPQRTDRKGAAYRRGLREVFAEADTLIAVSDFLAGRLVDLGAPASTVRVHHIGIPVTGPAPSEDGRRQGITFVGRLVEVKGVRDLLEAAARLRGAGHHVPVRVVGDGPLRGELERQARAAGLDVTFLGFCPPAEVAEVLRSTAVLCAPSRTAPDGAAEGFGMVYLEAALAGVPVVAYRHGGVPEAVQDGVTGLLAPEGDVAALAGHLTALVADPGRARAMGMAGRARVLRDFDVVRRAETLEDLYAGAAARAGTRR